MINVMYYKLQIPHQQDGHSTAVKLNLNSLIILPYNYYPDTPKLKMFAPKKPENPLCTAHQPEYKR